MSLETQIELESTYVMHTFARKPVEFVAGNAMTLRDDTGKTYLDFLAGIGVCSLGHCHPKVVHAIREQAERLIHVSNYYYIEHRGQVAQTISDLLNSKVPFSNPEPWRVFFANSGAEANECAIKLARLYATKRSSSVRGDAPAVIVTLDNSFHGRTLATLAATAQPLKQESFKPLPAGFVSTPQNDVDALERLFDQMGDQICAIILECIQGESGVHPCSESFLKAARRLTEDHDALLICDEVQCGVFRTGEPFGFQLFGITPDIVTIAKGVAGGFPTGMCAAKASVADAYGPGDHGTTFGGSCLAIAAAQATLETLIEEDFGSHVRDVGTYMKERLALLPHVTDVRGYGLMLGVDVDESCLPAPQIVDKGLEAGFVFNATGPRTLRFLPPLICSETEVDSLIEALQLIMR